MPISIECPLCGHKGQVPDKFDGKQVKCPSCCNLFFASPAQGTPALAKTSGSQAGTMKSPTSGSQAGTMKSPTSGSQAGTMKSPTAGSAAGNQKIVAKSGSAQGTQKKPGSAQGTQKRPAASSQGTKKKPGAKAAPKGPVDPFASFTYDDDTSAGTAYRKRRRRSSLKGCFVLLFLLVFLGTIGGGGFFVFFYVQKGGNFKELLAQLMPKRSPETAQANPNDQAPDTKNGEDKKDSTESKEPEDKPPAGPIIQDMNKGPAKVRDVLIHVDGLAYAVPPGKDLEVKDKFFIVRVRVENTGANIVNFEGWGTLEVINEKHPPVLIEASGKVCKRVTFGPGKLVEGQVLAESIKPGQSVSDVIVFEVPAADTNFVKIELSTENFGGKQDEKVILLLDNARLAKSGLPRPDKTETKPAAELELKELAIVALYRGPAGLKGKLPQILEALAIFAELGPAASTATPDIIPILDKHGDSKARAAAALCLGKFGVRAKAAIPTLIEHLKNDEDMKVKAECATALGQMAPDAVKDALPVLKELEPKEKDEMVLMAIKEAIKQLEKRDAPKVP